MARLYKLIIIKLKSLTYPKGLEKELTKQNFMQKEDVFLEAELEKVLENRQL